MSKVRVLKGTPAALGYSFPPEWARHSATWLSWPRPEGISFPGKYHTVPGSLAAIVAAIAPRELMRICVPNENYERIVRAQLRAGGVSAELLRRRVRCHFIATNECWCRDHGPAFVVRRGRGGRRQFAIVDWGFNAWGGKYPPYDADDAVPTRIAEELRSGAGRGSRRGGSGTAARVAGVFYPRCAGRPVVMEGGAVDFNGAGAVLTTESCLLSPNRNPHLSRRQLDRCLRDYYGQRHVIWLGDGIAGDDTDGHIDDLVRFIGPRTVVIGLEDDPRDANYRVLRDTLRRLELARDQDGRPLQVVTLPMPGVVAFRGQRLPATYMNFYFVNGALLVPTYGDRRRDRWALETLQTALPRRRVIGLDCRELIWGLGAIHCLTQQQPG
jgi:agmatine deiminase